MVKITFFNMTNRNNIDFQMFNRPLKINCFQSLNNSNTRRRLEQYKSMFETCQKDLSVWCTGNSFSGSNFDEKSKRKTCFVFDEILTKIHAILLQKTCSFSFSKTEMMIFFHHQSGNDRKEMIVQ